MAKTRFKTLAALLAAIICLSFSALALTACGEKPAATTFKVTFYDGDAVIATETVKEGEKVAAFTPADKNYSKTGFTFGDWYSTSDFTHDFRFDTVIKEDKKVYSKWNSSQEDVRQWTIAGESSSGGPLKTIGWNGGIITTGDNANVLAKTADKNEFKITLNLYAGDNFQFCVQNASGVWQSNDAGIILARGGQFLTANEYMVAASGGLGDGQSNIIVNASGNYTLTLTTDAINDKIGEVTVVRNGDAPVITIDRTSYTWYIYGSSLEQNDDSILGKMSWGNGYETEGLTNAAPYAMKKTSNNDPDGTGTWLLTGKFSVGDEFLFSVLTVGTKKLNAESGTMFGFAAINAYNGLEANFESKGMGCNIGVKVAGFYTFEVKVTLNTQTNALQAAIEVFDNVKLLQDGKWIVMGNRLSYAQVTGKVEDQPDIANGKLGITMTQEEYDAYVSDVGGVKNNFGKGEDADIAKLTKDTTASTGGNAVYKLTMALDVGDYFYFAIPSWVYNVKDFGQTYYGTVNGVYNSTVTPKMAAETLPAEFGAVWTNNFVCLAKGSYSFTLTIDQTGALGIAVAAAVA